MLLVQWTADFEAPKPEDVGGDDTDAAGGEDNSANVDRCAYACVKFVFAYDKTDLCCILYADVKTHTVYANCR